MRFPPIISCLLLLAALAGCSTWERMTGKDGRTPDSDDAPTESPADRVGDLKGPAYDPSAAPAVMTENTPLPTAGGRTPSAANPPAEGPQTYSTTPPTYANPAPVPYGQQPPAADQAAKGGNQATTALTADEAAIAPVLDGDWYNVADDREVVRFSPTHYYTFFEGELLVEEEMHYYADCPASCTGGETLGIGCFTIAGPASTDCYGVVRLTNDVLELSMLGVSTETVTYRKIQ